MKYERMFVYTMYTVTSWGERMSKKLQGNGLWESSRMILPEHKEAIQKFRRRREQRNRPEIDEHEIERINSTISWSLHARKPIRLKMFDPYEELIVEGVVDRANRLLGKICVDGEWFLIADVIGVVEPGE